MASLVRDAAVKDKALEQEMARLLVANGLDSHSDPYEVADVIFKYVQKNYAYIADPAGAFDSVQSPRQVIRDKKGDCDDLSVLLATLLSLVGFKPRFVLAKYKTETDGYDHVYVDLELPRGRLALDPSTRRNGIGWESPKAIERVAYPIFNGKVVGLGDLAAKAKNIFAGMAGFAGCGCKGGCGCEGATSIAGNVNGASVLASNVTLSFPAVLFGVGVIFAAMKIVDWMERN